MLRNKTCVGAYIVQCYSEHNMHYGDSKYRNIYFRVQCCQMHNLFIDPSWGFKSRIRSNRSGPNGI